MEGNNFSGGTENPRMRDGPKGNPINTILTQAGTVTLFFLMVDGSSQGMRCYCHMMLVKRFDLLAFRSTVASTTSFGLFAKDHHW